MSTSVFDSVLLKNLWSTEEMRQVFSDNVRMQMWLDYEAALAVEQAKMGIILRKPPMKSSPAPSSIVWIWTLFLSRSA